MIKRGNHLSARKPRINADTLRMNYKKEVERGWMLPITVRCLKKMKGAAVIPVGVHTQHTIDENGNRKIKRRTTHDASFPPPSSLSVNDRMDRDMLNECFYGHCLLRVLHKIQRMRIRHPKLRILLLKIDLDAAYRRLHVKAAMALLTITIINEIAYILLRLPFGVANGPNDYSIISEPIFDLTNDILGDDTFDPNTIHSPIQSKLEKLDETLKRGDPFGEARPLIVDVPFHYAAADGYIDDIITMVVDLDDWVWKAINAAPLAIHSLFRPTDTDDPIPRDETISTRKLKGEGTPSERKTILGWLIDTRTFRIYLPKEKMIDWRYSIRKILETHEDT